MMLPVTRPSAAAAVCQATLTSVAMCDSTMVHESPPLARFMILSSSNREQRSARRATESPRSKCRRGRAICERQATSRLGVGRFLSFEPTGLESRRQRPRGRTSRGCSEVKRQNVRQIMNKRKHQQRKIRVTLGGGGVGTIAYKYISVNMVVMCMAVTKGITHGIEVMGRLRNR